MMPVIGSVEPDIEASLPVMEIVQKCFLGVIKTRCDLDIILVVGDFTLKHVINLPPNSFHGNFFHQISIVHVL